MYVQRKAENGKSLTSASRNGFANRYIGRCDAWSRGLLVLNAPETIRSIPFEQLVSQATRVRGTERKSVAGREMVVVKLFFDRGSGRDYPWDVEIYFDPAYNYLVSKTVDWVHFPNGGTTQREDEVIRFKECTPGVFFPEKLAGRTGPDGKWDFTHTTAISDIRVTQPIAADVFHFRYPAGIYITDTIRGTRYRVDAAGNRTSSETPLGRVPPPPVGDTAERIEPGTETREEPRPASHWILPGSLGILRCAGIVALVRIWQRRGQPGEAGQ
jgi:hypothetical protein